MPTDKGSALNQKIWTLFANAGFTTKPNSNDRSTEAFVELPAGKKRKVDLLAELPELGVRIIGENKARKDLSGSFSAYVHDYQELKKMAGADAVLFVSDEKELPLDDKKYAQEKGFSVWEHEDLEYFETLVDTLGEYAKYEILHYLGIQTSEEAHIYNVLALYFHQPYSDSAADAFLFTIPPEILLKTSVVLRKASGNSDAYQRILRKERLSKIANFVTQADALLPPNIIVHLSDKVNWELLDIPDKNSSGRKITLARKDNYDLVLLQIPMEYASMELIDGQHRLFGFVNTELATRKSFNLVVLGLANVPPKKRTETFVAINDNAKRMDPNLVAYLKLTLDESDCQKDNELMAINVVYKLNQTTPFKKKIRLLDTGSEKITLKGFTGYDLKGLLGEKGLLRKYYPSNNSDTYVAILRIYFSLLKSTFPDEWNDPERYIIFTNRGISAFLKLLKSILKTEEEPLSEEVIRKYLDALKKGWKGGWEIAMLKNSYIGAKGWKDFHRDIIKAIKRIHRKFKE